MERPTPMVGGSCRLLDENILADFVTVDREKRIAEVTYVKSDQRLYRIVN
jgi:hypothetical protein